MTRLDHDAAAEALLERVDDVRSQVLHFVRQLDGIGVAPGYLADGAVEALAEADAALCGLQARLGSGEATVSEVADAERTLDTVESHIREVQQDLWRSIVEQRAH